MKFDIALLIPTFNESQIIKKTLSSFSKEADKRVLFVVIDNGSKDDTVTEINKWQKNNKRPMVLLFEKKKGALYAKRKGLFYAKNKAEVVISTDADCRPLTGFYKNIRKYFLNNSNIDILAGHLRHDSSTRLLKHIYLGGVMNLVAWQENVERMLFGPFFFGGYFGVRSSRINNLAFPTGKIPSPKEATVFWSKHCYYLGYKFGFSKRDMRTSSRRFWSDPYGFISGDRLKPIRDELKSYSSKKKLLSSLREKQSLLIELRQRYFAKRLLMFLIDAFYFMQENKVKNKTCTSEVINKTFAYLNLKRESIEPLISSDFEKAKKEILNGYETQVIKKLSSIYGEKDKYITSNV